MMSEIGIVTEVDGNSVVVNCEGTNYTAEQPKKVKDKVGMGDTVEVYKVGQRILISKSEAPPSKEDKFQKDLEEESAKLEFCLNEAKGICSRIQGKEYGFAGEDIRSLGTTLYLAMQKKNRR